MAIEVDIDGSGTIDILYGGTNASTAAGARVNLGLGTAATLNVGTSGNQIVQLDSSGRLPAVDGSQLLNVQGTGGEVTEAPVDSVNGQTGIVVLNADNIGDGVVNIIPTATQESNWDAAFNHSQTTHAPANAEQNVQPDWNATSGDAFILNKPSLGSAALQDVGTEAGTVAAGNDPRFSDIGSGFNMPEGMVLVMLNTYVDTQPKIDAILSEYNITADQLLMYTPGEVLSRASMAITTSFDNIDLALLHGDLVPVPMYSDTTVENLMLVLRHGGTLGVEAMESELYLDSFLLSTGTSPDLPAPDKVTVGVFVESISLDGTLFANGMLSAVTVDSTQLTSAGGTFTVASMSSTTSMDTPTISEPAAAVIEGFEAASFPGTWSTGVGYVGDSGYTFSKVGGDAVSISDDNPDPYAGTQFAAMNYDSYVNGWVSMKIASYTGSGPISLWLAIGSTPSSSETGTLRFRKGTSTTDLATITGIKTATYTQYTWYNFNVDVGAFNNEDLVLYWSGGSNYLRICLDQITL